MRSARPQAPSLPMVRRHARGGGALRLGPPVSVVGGNYVAAKRRGIVNGVDFGEAAPPAALRGGVLPGMLRRAELLCCAVLRCVPSHLACARAQV